MKKIKKKRLLIFIIVLIGIFACTYGVTFAKYVYNSVWDYYLISKGFYFDSDKLSVNGTNHVNNEWDGNSIDFKITNNMNDNLTADYDINYDVSCILKGEAKDYATCQLSEQSGVLTSYKTCVNTLNDGEDVSELNKRDCELGGYNWENQPAIKNLYFDVVLTDNSYELKDVTVDVTVTSSYPYKKVLTGTFVLTKGNPTNDTVSMKYNNYASYDRLIITNTYSESKKVKITWDSDKLLIDADETDFISYNTDSNGYINEIEFEIGEESSIDFLFYKKDFNAVYDITEFTMELI